MTEISFYVLASSAMQDRFVTACKLIEKAFKQGSICNVLTESEAHSKQLDDLLWTFRQGSFIPHQIQTDAYLPNIPQILISSEPAILPKSNILVNLTQNFPEDFAQFPRVIEIMINNEIVKEAGRKRYRRYQQMGANLTSYNL